MSRTTMIRQDQIAGTPFITEVPILELRAGMMVQVNGSYRTLADIVYNPGDTSVMLVFDHGDYQTMVSYPTDANLTVRQ